MLKKENRLLEKTRFEKNWSTPFFVLKTAKNRTGVSRFAFQVSKKTEKNAVLRNRIKRQIRSCIEKQIGEIKTGTDFLFIIKKEAIRKETSRICEEVYGLLKKQNLLE